MNYHFNPRPREEGDLVSVPVAVVVAISIHALVKRATYGGDKVLAELGDFNPRPREEGDKRVAVYVKFTIEFQSTPS